jgi:hypothetical protein
MPIVVANSAEADTLKYLLNISTTEDLDIKLFSNNHSPADTDTVSNFTELANSFGYNLIQLVPASWGVVEGNPTIASYPQITWTFTGAAGNVYGFYIVGRTSGTLKWAERFSNAPYNIVNNGDQIKITPKIALD